jgi:hypothetical protein
VALDALMELGIEVTDPDADDEEMEQCGRLLRDALLDAPIDLARVAPRSLDGDRPEGAKAAGEVDWTHLLVAMSAAGGALPVLLGAVRDWVQRRAYRSPGTSVTVRIGDDSIELSSATTAQAEVLIDAFVRARRTE